MNTDEHGGGCCGASHLSAFGHTLNQRYDGLESMKTEIKNRVNYLERQAVENNWDDGDPKPWKKFGHLIEIMLTDNQMMMWAPALKEFGFKLHTRWMNDNSGNYCNLLSYRTKKPADKAPYTW